MINALMGVAAIEWQMAQLEAQLNLTEAEVTRLNDELDRLHNMLWLAQRMEVRNAND